MNIKENLEFPYTTAEIQHIAECWPGFIPICQYLAPIARQKDTKTGLDVLFNCYLAFVAATSAPYPTNVNKKIPPALASRRDTREIKIVNMLD